MVDFMIPKERSRAEDQDHIFGLQDSKVPWDKALEGGEAQDSWLTFKDQLFQTQEQQIPMNCKSGKKWQEACMGKQGNSNTKDRHTEHGSRDR